MAANAFKPRVYHISIWRYLILWWALGPFLLLGLGLAIFSDAKTKGAGIAIVCLMAPFLLLWHWLVRKSRLEISPQGVRLREAGSDLKIAWPEITGIRLDRGHEGFITARSIEGKGAERLAANAGPMQMHDTLDMQLLGEQRFIPIKAFAFHLRSGDMREVILGYAPHLKSALDAVPTPPRRLTSAERRRNWIVACLIAASLALSAILVGKGERWQAWFFTVAYGILDPLVALFAAIGAWQLLRKRNWLLGVLSALLALVMAGWAVKNWDQFQRLLHNAPSPQARQIR